MTTPEIRTLTATLHTAELVGPVARLHLVIDTATRWGTIAARTRCPRDGVEPLTVIDALGAWGEGATPEAAANHWLRTARAELCRLRSVERAMHTLRSADTPCDQQRNACETLLKLSSRFDHVTAARAHLARLDPGPIRHAAQ